MLEPTDLNTDLYSSKGNPEDLIGLYTEPHKPGHDTINYPKRLTKPFSDIVIKRHVSTLGRYGWLYIATLEDGYHSEIRSGASSQTEAEAIESLADRVLFYSAVLSRKSEDLGALGKSLRDPDGVLGAIKKRRAKPRASRAHK